MEGVKNRDLAFTRSGDVGAVAGKGVGTLEGAQGATDLLLHFDHANLLFGQIIGERNPRIFPKAQNVLPIIAEAVQEVDGLGLGQAAALTFFTVPPSSGHLLIALGEDAIVAHLPPPQGGRARIPMGSQQQGLHGGEPTLTRLGWT